AKSKYSPGPAPKSATQTYTLDGDWIVAKVETVDSEGKPTTTTNRFRRDGKEYPFTVAAGDKGMIAVKSINAKTTDSTLKAGTAIPTVHQVLANDGKSVTRTTTGTNATGQKVNNVIVFEKQ